MRIRYKLDDGAFKPTKSHERDAGFDLYAPYDAAILPGYGLSIDTGVHFDIPEGYAGEVVGRSGLNHGLNIICPQGTVDSGYTGSIRVKLYNLGKKEFTFAKGDRIAQIVFVPIADVRLVETKDYEDERGTDGFGSTGR